MNLTESLKHVLLNRSQGILSEFLERDFKVLLTQFGSDIKFMYQSGTSSLKLIKKKNITLSAQEVYVMLSDFFVIIKHLPKRIKDGFSFFKEDFLLELEAQPDTKHKTVFALKVIGAITSFTVSVLYTVKKGKGDFTINGLKKRNAFTKVIFAEFVFRITGHFLDKFLQEVEEHITVEEEATNIRYFRQLLKNPSEQSLEEDLGEADRSIEIVENLKKYILYGKR